jgi:4-aminobutyrate aminotransferase
VGIELPEIFQWYFDPILPLAICRIGGRDITMQKYNLPGPKAKALIERDQAVISPSYARAYPFAMEHGKGTEVWDVDGNRFLDFAAGIAVTATGHCHPKVVQAIKDQADKFLHISADFYHQSWVR